jgi:hypothetical protein
MVGQNPPFRILPCPIRLPAGEVRCALSAPTMSRAYHTSTSQRGMSSRSGTCARGLTAANTYSTVHTLPVMGEPALRPYSFFFVNMLRLHLGCPASTRFRKANGCLPPPHFGLQRRTYSIMEGSYTRSSCDRCVPSCCLPRTNASTLLQLA